MKAEDYIELVKLKRKMGEYLSPHDLAKYSKVLRKYRTSSFMNYCKHMTGFEFPWFQELIINEADTIIKNGSGRLIVQVGQQHGKLLADSVMLKTTDGYICNRDVKIGTVLDSGQGFTTKVLGVFPEKNVKMYRIYFEDGRSTLCSIDHLWEIRSTKFRKDIKKVLTTEEIIKYNSMKRYSNTLYIPRYVPLDVPDSRLSIEPYLLGALLGDGYLGKSLKITSADSYIVNRCDKDLRQHGMRLRKNRKYEYSIMQIINAKKDSRGRISLRRKNCPFKKLLTDSGLYGRTSEDKFVPGEYFNASYRQRLSLIQGLMDTDGSVSVGRGDNVSIEYTTVSPRLANDFQKLIRSIGGLCRIKTRYTYCGDKRGKLSYRCSVRVSDQSILFGLPRKKDRCKSVHRRSEANKWLRVKNIEFSHEEDARCILTDNDRSLYVCDDYIVTHNSELLGRQLGSYIMGLKSEWKCLYLTYSDTRAKEISAMVLDSCTDDKFSVIFPNFKLKDDLDNEVRSARKKKDKVSISNFTNANSKRGEWKACGIEGSYNGYSANLIIIDDYFSGHQEAQSDTVNETRWHCFTRNILTRQQKDTIIILISTQWRPDDILGRMETYSNNLPEGALPWKRIVLNAIKDERDYPYDHREVGEYLWAEMKMNFYLEYKELDPVGWDITCMNNPGSTDRKPFGVDSFRYFDEWPDFKRMIVIISNDPNYKKKAKKADDSATIVIGIKDRNLYLLDFHAQPRVSHKETKDKINDFRQRFPNYMAVLVEDKAAGEGIVQLFEEEGEIKIERFETNLDKRTRAQFLLPYTTNGLVHVPSRKLRPDINTFTQQFFDFTGADGNKDDYVDAFTQVVIHYAHLLAPIKAKKACFSIKRKYNNIMKGGNPLVGARIYGA